MAQEAFAIKWDEIGKRFYETGVDRVVLYLTNPEYNPATSGSEPYLAGVPWSGVTSISQSSSGGEATPLWADNIKYLNLISAEEAQASIEAYTYPVEFEQCDGIASVATGATIGQQSRQMFGLTYRTRIGNDIKQDDLGYKIHFLYGCLASPTDRSYATVNDSPEAIGFSWSITTTPVSVTNYKPTAVLTVDSRTVTPAKLTTLEEIIYGKAASGNTAAVDPKLPLPDDIISTLS